MFATGLKPGEIIGNRELMNIFHCACEGGIRYSSKTGTVVIVVNNTKKGLPNILREDEILFAGRLFKDGETYAGANKRLAEFLREGKPVFLFEVDVPGRYEYRGPVRAAGEPGVSETASGEKYPLFPLLLSDGGD